jgi:HKD family nuclease
MAKVQILNPHDQPTGKWRLINELRKALASDDYETLLIAVAFAKTGPLLRLKTEIEQWQKKGKKICSIFGVNHRNTSKQALEFALANFTKASVLFHSDDFTYHPKMYLFLGANKCKFFIGSHNLTVGGTETNWESGTELSLHLPEDKDMLAEALVAWESLLSSSAELTTSLIDKYKIFGKLSDETEPRRRKAPAPVVEGDAAPKQDGPPRLILKIKPPSPLPKGLFVTKASAKPVATSKTEPIVATTQKQPKTPVSTEALVIQIVPHDNGEVFLSKIAINQNPEFFGYPFKGLTIPKKPGNTSYPQRDPDPIVDLKIYGTTAVPVVHLPRLALNTVYYTKNAEIRITVPQEVVQNTPELSILVMRQAPDDSDFDYEMEVFPPNNPQYNDYLAVCNQTMPSGGRANPRRMGWL